MAKAAQSSATATTSSKIVDLFAPSTSDGYSPSKFYTRSRDDNGHSTHLRVKVPDHLPDRIANLTSLIPGPYRSRDDFVRDAMIHRVRWIEENYDDPKVKAEARAVAKMLEIEHKLGEREAWESSTEELEHRIKQLGRAQDPDAVRLLDELREDVLTFPDPFRTRLLSAVDRATR